jgi:hypothetical protein
MDVAVYVITRFVFGRSCLGIVEDNRPNVPALVCFSQGFNGHEIRICFFERFERLGQFLLVVEMVEGKLDLLCGNCLGDDED